MSVAQIKDAFLAPLFSELKLRFDHLTEPCLTSLATRLSQRLVDNLQAFKTVPQFYRMTNRPATTHPSHFLETTLRPLASLTDQKMFAALSEQVRLKIYESVLTNALRELRTLIEPIIAEERKMHESLKKYQKGSEGANEVLSDFDKMMIQYYVVRRSIVSSHCVNVGR